MELILDRDVQKVVEFMYREIPAEKLLFVARSLSQVAELAWQQYIPQVEKPQAVQIFNKPIIV